LKKLALYTRIFFTAVVICAASLTATLVFRPPNFILYALLIFAAGLAAFLLLIAVRKNFTAAQVIADNAIIYIQPAVLRGDDCKNINNINETVGMCVSCFGIMLGGKIIKFNQNSIWLRNVEIGQDYISFDYGARNKELQNIRLLYSRPDGDILAGIIEKFRKETGVVPTIAG